MGIAILITATAPLADGPLWDRTRIPHGEDLDIRSCRAIDCERVAQHDDDFCPRCREEIDALHAMPPWRAKLRRR